MAISNEDAERAVEWIRSNAREIAQKRAEREYMEQWLKVVKAESMRAHKELSIAAQEREALTSPAYFAALTAFKEAIFADEHIRWLATAAETKVSAWQTQCRLERVGP